MVSISIDPDHDTPARLKAYAEKFQAGADWQFLTGTRADTLAVQRAFDAYRGSKMNHAPLTLLRASSGSPWVRLDGFASASELVAEVKKLSAASVALGK
jgi:protein SCO1/2